MNNAIKMLKLEEILEQDNNDIYVQSYQRNLLEKRWAVQKRISSGLTPTDFAFFTCLHEALEAAIRILHSITSGAQKQEINFSANAEMDSTTVKQLAELGFLAMGRSRVAEAKAIVAGLKTCRPQDATPYVIEAFNALNANRLDEAEAQINKGLACSPDDELISTTLSLILKQKGQNMRANSILEEVLHSDDPIAKNFAHEVQNIH